MVLLLSILIRIAAAIVSGTLLRRVRDWRMGFLTAMLLLMALRQSLTLRRAVAESRWDLLSPTQFTIDELPGLVVSILAALSVIFLGRIIERQRKLYQELQEKRERTLQSQKMEALGTLAGRTAHDFNNLLTVIVGSSELIGLQLEESHPAKSHLGELESATDRAVDLASQILSFSRRQVAQRDVFDLNEVILELESMLRRLLGPEIRYGTRLSLEPAMIKADMRQIEQVIINLAANARDAMSGGGTLIIETTHESEAPGDPRASGSKRMVVRVRDTGSGIAPEQWDRVFEPYFTTKPVDKGTGLGLSSCLGIVEGNGGRILIEASSPEGTTFQFSFPSAETIDVSSNGEGAGQDA